LLVLDVHGVVLNNPLPDFLSYLDTVSSGTSSAKSRWAKIRKPFWEGKMSDEQMWSKLAPGHDSHRLREELEARYAPGPYYHHLVATHHPCWLLTNHRAQWLAPRLERFGLESRFEKVLVSDELEAAKPSFEAFAPVIEMMGENRVTFVDDNALNVDAARMFGMDSVLADDCIDWSAIAA
jgi:HAD superfamily hydrolase (TIGR01509 family)